MLAWVVEGIRFNTTAGVNRPRLGMIRVAANPEANYLALRFFPLIYLLRLPIDLNRLFL